MNFSFIADSAADLPEEIIDKYNIDVFPLYIHHGDKEYKDRVEMAPGELYDRMRSGEDFKTSQVKINDFLVRFKEYAKRGKKVIYIAFSSELSGTFQSAVLAKKQVKNEYPDFDLTIIDSRCASLGAGLSIYKTIQVLENSDDKQEVIEKASFFAEHMEHIFTVDDLEYLVRGGRLNKVAGFVGGILNIKPIINVENGKLEAIEKKKGKKRVLKRMVDIMEKRGTDLENQTIGIVHADDQQGAMELKEMISDRFGCKSFITNLIGAVIGAHTGPGCLGVFFLNENRRNTVSIK